MNKNELKNPTSWGEKIVLINLAILTFFVFFGTSLPFQEYSAESWEHESTNIITQIVYTFLFLFSLPLLLTRYKDLINFVFQEKFLTILILLSLVSALWSDYSFLSIKRSFTFFVVYIVILNAFVFADFKKILKALKIVFSIYLIVTYLTCFTIPGAIDPKFGTWRGIEIQKNGLGQVGTLIFIISLMFYDKNSGRNARIFNYLFSLLSIILIFMSGSSTAIAAFFMVILSAGVFKIEKMLRPLKFGRFFSAIAAIYIVVSMIIIGLFGDQILELFPEIFGKDLTFTGRTYIWDYVLSEINKKPILGYGFETYWIMGSSRLNVFKVNQSHNSYLEIMLQLGSVGIIVLLSIVIAFLYRAIKLSENKSIIALITILTLSFSEGVLLRSRSETTFTFLFFYLLVSESFFRLDNSPQSKVEPISRYERNDKFKLNTKVN